MASLFDEIREVSRGWRWGHRPLPPSSAEASTGPRDPREFPTEWARTPVARAARDAIHRYVLKPLVWNETDPLVEGLDRLAALTPPVVFVSNHSSHLDTPLILCSLPKPWRDQTAVGAATDYFFDVWWRSLVTPLVFNAFPVDRAGGRRATDTARRLAAEGWNILLYPEGTRSPDGWLRRFRHGAARLCAELRLPVVPVGIRGAYAAMPRGRYWPRRGRPHVSIRYGPPLVLEPGEDFRTLSQRMFKAVARLIDEDQTSWWESIQRAARGETPTHHGPDAPTWRRVWEGSRSPRRDRPRAWGA